jgi:hypothetical protein
MNDPNEPEAIVRVASNTKVGQPLAFKISGEGILRERGEAGNAQGSSGEEVSPSGQSQSQAQAQGRDAGPGGGLGPPVDAPDPLQKYRWYILGGFAAALAIGAAFVASRQQSAARAATRARLPRGTDGSVNAD